MKTFDPEKCGRRKRLAAARGAVEGVAMRFLKDPVELKTAASGLVDRFGSMPASEDSLTAINAGLPESAAPLTDEDVYVHYVEAANGSFLPDRFAFLSTSTLINIAKGGQSGVAFMNSHRTGDMSTPSELPFGRTFAGAYEASLEDGKLVERAYLGFYMLRGIKPNGDGGPSTDDLHRMIEGGQLFDVSVGLLPGAIGKAICNVCDTPYRSCAHYAGDTDEMTLEEQEAAIALGIPGGQASYRLEDYELCEVSGVYDGAVPGAGFSKGLARFAQFTDEQRTRFRELFKELMATEDDDDQPPALKRRLAAAPPDPISAPGGQPGSAGTSTAPPAGAETQPPKNTMSLRQSLMNKFGGRGFGRFVSALNGTTSEDPELLSTLLSDQVEAQAADLTANDPIILLAKAHGISNTDQFNVLLGRAKDGDQYLADVREEAKKEAIRLFGAINGPIMGAAIDGQNLAQAKISRDAWRKEADEKYGIGSNGEPATRKTAPAGNLAVDVDEEKEPKTSWEKLTADQRSLAAKYGYDTDEKREAFAKNFLEVNK